MTSSLFVDHRFYRKIIEVGVECVRMLMIALPKDLTSNSNHAIRLAHYHAMLTSLYKMSNEGLYDVIEYDPVTSSVLFK